MRAQRAVWTASNDGSGMLVSIAETGGDVEARIFQFSKENEITFHEARVELRENHTYTAKALEPHDYNNRLVREKELVHSRIWATQFSSSEYSARDELKMRVGAKSSEDLIKKQDDLLFIGNLDIMIAIDAMHQRLFAMYEPAMVDEDKYEMLHQIAEVTARMRYDLLFIKKAQTFVNLIKQYVETITAPDYGVTEEYNDENELKLDEFGAPIDEYQLRVDKQLPSAYESLVRGRLNTQGAFTDYDDQIADLNENNLCIKWNKYVAGAGMSDCNEKADSAHAKVSHFCLRHGRYKGPDLGKHRETQCHTLRCALNAAPYDRFMSKPAVSVPNCYHLGTRDGNQGGGSRGRAPRGRGRGSRRRTYRNNYRGGYNNGGGYSTGGYNNNLSQFNNEFGNQSGTFNNRTRNTSVPPPSSNNTKNNKKDKQSRNEKSR